MRPWRGLRRRGVGCRGATSSAEADRELDQALSRLALEPGTSGRALEALSAGQDAIAALASEILHKEAERKDRERRVAAAGSDGGTCGGKRWRVCVSVGRHVPPVPPWTHSGRHCGVYVPPCPGWLWNMCALPMPNPAAPSMGPLPGRNPARLLSCSVPYWRCSGCRGRPSRRVGSSFPAARVGRLAS